jgi:hypothetical protein
MIAQLPLLVLPANAHAELQGLFDAATARGLDEGAAYRELLPLLQDWAALMLWLYSTEQVGGGCPTSGSSAPQCTPGTTTTQMQVEAAVAAAPGAQGTLALANSRGSSASSKAGCHQNGQQQQQQLLVYLHEELVASVSSFLDAYELTECFKLLTLQQWQQQHASVGPADAAAAADAASPASSAAPVPAGGDGVDLADPDQAALTGSSAVAAAELLAEQLPDEAADLMPSMLSTTLLSAVAAGSPRAVYPATGHLPGDAPSP